MNYEKLKATALELGVPAYSLYVLAAGNDPFYIGTPAHLKTAHWFADLWDKFDIRPGMHLRGIHYLLVTHGGTVVAVDGTDYQNTEEHWKLIGAASKLARYLDLVPISAFRDKRAPPAVIYSDGASSYYPKYFETEAYGGWLHVEPLTMPYLPTVSAGLGVSPPTEFHVEIWCEKSTMNDVLEPICEDNYCNLVTGLGEMSVTAVNALMDRVIEVELPVRILYISDFDPAGKSMPVAVSRKCEFMLQERGADLDMIVQPIVLNEHQVKQYNLPRVPIKNSERRAANFEDVYGEGAVELDALEALHPGVLKELVLEAMARYRDFGLRERIAPVALDAEIACFRVSTRIKDQYAAEIEQAQAAFDETQEAVNDWVEEYSPLWREIAESLREAAEGKWELPRPEYAPEFEEPLFDSSRSYMDQLASYKSFQHK